MLLNSTIVSCFRESVQYTNTCTDLEVGSIVLAVFKRKWGRCRIMENDDPVVRSTRLP
jgi:hypothetical protein